MPLCVIQDIRDEGFTDSVRFPDSLVQDRIDEAVAYITAVTSRFFEPTDLVFKLDGHGQKDLLLQHPIIDITEIRILGQDISSQDVILESDEFVFYNRHLREGLLDPDDRDNPKISLVRLTDDSLGGIRTTFRAGIVFGSEFFPFGVQNIQVTGKFGYTDPDLSATFPQTPGTTPILIKRVCKLLTIRNLPQLSELIDPGEEAQRRGPIIEERVRDQSLKYARTTKEGAFTGDPEIDDLLARYMRPMHLGAA